MSLWFANALLVLVTLLFLLKPLLAKQSRDGGRGGASARGLLADRLGELERERAAGLVGEDEYALAKRETEAAYEACADEGESSLRTPAAAAAVVLLTTVAAAVFYFYYSDGYRLLLAERQATGIAEDFAATRAALQRRLQEQPQDTEARRLLAVTLYLTGDYAAAAAEYRRTDELEALDDDDDWMNYADALLRSGGAARGGRVLEALAAMLMSKPAHQRALLFSGLLHFERGEYARATDYWQRLLVLLPADTSDLRQELQQLIARARDKVGAPKTEGVGGAITVTVSLAEALRADAAPGDTVFVYARALDGPPMPLAVVRLTVAELPAEVRLDGSSAMMAGMSLDLFAQVEVVARVSRQGKALAAAGDLIGSVSPVAVGAAVAVEISSVVE